MRSCEGSTRTYRAKTVSAAKTWRTIERTSKPTEESVRKVPSSILVQHTSATAKRQCQGRQTDQQRIDCQRKDWYACQMHISMSGSVYIHLELISGQ